MEIKRTGSARWSGGLKDGQGTISTASGALSGVKYALNMRFENAPGTNPEELIGAAHASCFAMFLSGRLGAANLTAESIDATSTVTMTKSDAGWSIVGVHVDVSAKVPGASADQFQELAEVSKKGCPISKLLAGSAEITMTAKLA
jgi:osmotically inducible protein OsmC